MTLSGKGIDVFGTGDVAKMLHVAMRTVTKWCDMGKLPHHRIPASKDRRITRANLIAFLLEHGYPLPPQLSTIRLAVALDAVECALRLSGWVVAPDGFEAGRACGAGVVRTAIVGDEMGLARAVGIATTILAAYPTAVVVIVVSESAPKTLAGWSGRVERRPLDLGKLADELNTTEG